MPMRAHSLKVLLSLLLIIVVLFFIGTPRSESRVVATDFSFGKKQLWCDLDSVPPELLVQKRSKSVTLKRFIRQKIKRAKTRLINWRAVRRKLARQHNELETQNICEAYNGGDGTPTPSPTSVPGPGGGDDDSHLCSTKDSILTFEFDPGESLVVPIALNDICGSDTELLLIEQPSLFAVHVVAGGLEVHAPNFPFQEVAALSIRSEQQEGAPVPVVLRSRAPMRTVQVVDHSFVPKNIDIDEGDIVRWEWKADFHDVVSGVDPDHASGAFASNLLFQGDVFTATFDRGFLYGNPVTGDRYQYFCNPHYTMGMTGSVRVARRGLLLSALPNESEFLGQGSRTPEASCSFQLLGQELSGNCTFAGNFNAGELRIGGIGESGEQLCTISNLSSGGNFSCTLSADEEESLYGTLMFITLTDSFTPERRVRGQITRLGGGYAMRGRVLLQDGGGGLSGVRVMGGGRVAYTDAVGRFTLLGVPNGVHYLEASKDGYTILADPFVSPSVMNGSELLLRNFTATPS